MAHMTTRGSYQDLVYRLNLGPQGAPESDSLYAILRMLFAEEEAWLVSRLPLRPFPLARAARIWGKSLDEARKLLDALCDRGLILDLEEGEEIIYLLPPPMAGFFEFSMMRLNPKSADLALLGELFYQYMNVEEDFVRELFCDGQTRLGRVFVHEERLSPAAAPGPCAPTLQVLDYERASWVIDSATAIGVGDCYCRHKMMHMGKHCAAPIESICLTFNNAARSLIKHGRIRSLSPQEAREVVALAKSHNLVQFGENNREGVNFICNCCGCCCEAMVAARRFGHLHPVETSNYLPAIAEERCSGCGKCVRACPVEAMTLVAANHPRKKNRLKAKLDEEICLGCGVCLAPCAEQAITLIERERRVITPLSSVHRQVLMAIERNKLQNFIFDNAADRNHRAMAAVLGVILRLPPLKQLLASRQLRSRYLDRLLREGPHSGRTTTSAPS